MQETLEAVYENGVFRPLKNPSWLAEHRRVTLTVISDDCASSLVECVNRIPAEDAQEMREIIEREFESVDWGEWQ